jgi:hypothetical protein
MATEASLQFGFIDLAGSHAPKAGVEYSVLDAFDDEIESAPVGRGCGADDVGYLLTLQILTLWIDDLPDIGRVNEGVLKLTGRTRAVDSPEDKIDVSNSLDFRVRDNTRAGVDFNLGFTNLLIKNRLVLGFDLIELDKDASLYYQKVKDAIDPDLGKQVMDLAKSVPYLELATKLVDGLIQAFGKNANDPVWASSPMFAVRPAIGAPYLRSGIYVVYEDTPGDLPPRDLGYVNRSLVYAGTGAKIPRNNLAFAVQIEPPPSGTVDKLNLV